MYNNFRVCHKTGTVAIMCPKDAYRMVNSLDPDQISPFLISLIWVCTLGSCLSVPIQISFTVVTKKYKCYTLTHISLTSHKWDIVKQRRHR